MNFLKRLLLKNLLWILFTPYIVAGVGAASNQAVLIANHDKFPVMVNPVKLEEMRPKKQADEDFISILFGTPRPASTLETIADQNGMLDEIHCIMTPKTHLNALADIFDMHDAIYSIGDFGLMLGEWLNEFCPIVFFTLLFKKCWDADAI